MSATRRDFIRTSLAGASTLALASSALAAPAPDSTGFPNPSTEVTSDSPVPPFPTPDSTRQGDMLYRTLGQTGEKVSALGLGGFHLGKIPSDDDAIKLCRRAIDAGLTFMDNAWDYNNGKSEIRMGNALKDGYRKKTFLMTKLDGRTKDSANQQLEESLKRLQTDMIDLVQVHETIRLEDPDRVFAKGGAIEAYQDAKKAGKIRYIGFTGHKDPLVHLRMLEVAKAHGFRFDVAMMPLNVMDAHFRSFAHHVLPVLLKENMGVLSMKSMGEGIILKSKAVTPIECLHYALNLPTSVVIAGIDSEKILDQALEAAKTFSPLTKDQVAALLAKTAPFAAAGEFELFKTTDQFDSTAKSPQWLGQSKSNG